MLVARITVICIAVIGVFIARDPESSVFAIVSFAWAGFGAYFGPIMLFSLFWKRTNRNGALAGKNDSGKDNRNYTMVAKQHGNFNDQSL